MNLPEQLVKDLISRSEGYLFRGLPIKDMTKDELLAVCIYAIKEQRRILERQTSEREFWQDLSKARRVAGY